jgi:hypothetical protein
MLLLVVVLLVVVVVLLVVLVLLRAVEPMVVVVGLLTVGLYLEVRHRLLQAQERHLVLSRFVLL